MTNLTLRLRLAVILLLTATTLGAIPTIDELRAKLGDKTTASDSLELMFDIYDLTRYDQRAPILEELYGTAQRSGIESAIAETLVLLAACHEENDSMQAVLLKRAQDMPESDVQKSTLLYIKVRNAAREIRSLPRKRWSNTWSTVKATKTSASTTGSNICSICVPICATPSTEIC